MANFRQQHPTAGSSFSIQSSIIGITLNQDDFFSIRPGFIFQIDYGNNDIEQIQLGRTGMYETSYPITANITFPWDQEDQNFPKSLLLDIFQLE